MSTQGTADAGREANASRPAGAASSIVRLVLVGLVDALLIWALASAATAQWWLAVGFFVFALVAINVVYLTGRFLPLKFLLPGVLFLIVFQLYTMAFTAFSSFTNYGTGHLDDKQSGDRRHPGAERRPGRGRPRVPGRPDRPGRHGLDADRRSRHRRGVDRHQRGRHAGPGGPGDPRRRAGHRRRRVREPQPRHAEPERGLHGPVGGAAAAARRRTRASISARSRSPGPPRRGPATSTTRPRTRWSTPPRARCSPRTSPSATSCPRHRARSSFPGWLVPVGLQNYMSLFTDETLRSRVPADHRLDVLLRHRDDVPQLLAGPDAGPRAERAADGRPGDLPAAADRPVRVCPSLLMTLVWKGMLNTDFGVINRCSAQQIPWLTDPWLARFSVLTVNLWLGFPYFFLVCSGALTAIPADLKEAAYVDGASGRVRVPHRGAAAAARRDRAAAGDHVRVQLQQLHADRAAHRRRAVPGQHDRRRRRPTC